MSELRAPDPTLAAFHDDMLLPVVSYERTDDGSYRPMPNLVVHRYGKRSGHFVDPNLHRVPVIHIRYQAVPCRECFPDAPEPGYVNDCGCYTHCEGPCTPGLAWQVRS